MELMKCIDNEGYTESLEAGKIYGVVHDPQDHIFIWIDLAGERPPERGEGTEFQQWKEKDQVYKFPADLFEWVFPAWLVPKED